MSDVTLLILGGAYGAALAAFYLAGHRVHEPGRWKETALALARELLAEQGCRDYESCDDDGPHDKARRLLKEHGE